jgi:membrane-associated phospholipid phosphatase
MEDMRYLKENKIFIYAACLIPVLLFYFDRITALWFDHTYDNLKLHKALKYIDPVMNIIGNGLTLIIIGLLLYVIGKYYNRRLHLIGKLLFIGLLTTGAVVQVLKHFIGRARPKLTYDPVFIGPSFKSGYDSFPSGHSAMVFFFAYTLSRYFPKYRILFYLFALAVSFDRVEELAHFPSDILAGAILGLIVGKLFSDKISSLKVPAPQ